MPKHKRAIPGPKMVKDKINPHQHSMNPDRAKRGATFEPPERSGGFRCTETSKRNEIVKERSFEPLLTSPRSTRERRPEYNPIEDGSETRGRSLRTHYNGSNPRWEMLPKTLLKSSCANPTYLLLFCKKRPSTSGLTS